MFCDNSYKGRETTWYAVMRRKAMSSMEKMGEYAFLAFVIIAIVAGLVIGAVEDLQTVENRGWITLLLVILGIIVGLTTITEKESQHFLVAAIALAVAAGSNIFLVIDNVVKPLGSIGYYIVLFIAAFVIPAAVIMAMKAVYALARTK